MLSFLPRGLLLPPVLLLVGALACWGVAQRYPKAGLRLLGVCLVGLLVLALPVTPALLLGGLESGIGLSRAEQGSEPRAPFVALPPGASAPAAPKAIVILGGDSGFGRVQGAIFGGAQPGSLSLERLRAGAALQRRVGLPILITGGAPQPGVVPIAVVMRQSLQDDFRTEAQWVEPRSSDTWENAEFTAAQLAREGITSVYVVTHSWHMRRAMMAFRHFGLTVWPAPVSLTAYHGVTADMFVPSATAWMDSYFAVHEWVGCAYYALRG